MANEVHLQILEQGITAWNTWREQNPDVVPNLSNASLPNTDLSNANLKNVNFYNADLGNANLFCANLHSANLKSANFYNANLDSANLYSADLRNTNLRNANLYSADLSHADLEGANLSGAKLNHVQALGTHFQFAIFTGACIEYWNINSQTSLDDAECQYIFLRLDQEKGELIDRRPPKGEFALGDFAKLVQQSLNTVDLSFDQGIDWAALLASVQSLQAEAGGGEVDIQTIEHKEDGGFIIQLSVPDGFSKAQAEQYIQQEYTLALQALTSNQQLQPRNHQTTDLRKIAKLLASNSPKDNQS